jgi:hypothetical protein
MSCSDGISVADATPSFRLMHLPLPEIYINWRLFDQMRGIRGALSGAARVGNKNIGRV